MTSTPHSATAPANADHRSVTASIPFLRLLPLAAVALLSGLGATAWIARAGEVSLIGFLRAEQSVVYASHSGRMASVQARTGETVKPKQSLLQLSDPVLDHEIAAKSREVAALQATLDQCRALAEVQLSLEWKSLDEELLRTRLESAKYLREHFAANFEHVTWRNIGKEAHTGRWLAASPDFLNQPERLFDTVVNNPVMIPEDTRLGAVMRQELARNSSEVHKAQSELCDHHISDLQKLRQSQHLPEMIRKAAGVDVAEAKLADATAQLDVLNQQLAALSVMSPGHGVVGAYSKQVADPISAGEALVTIHDRDRPFVEVDVPSRQISKLQIGQTIRLDFAGEDRTGRVESISPQAHHRDLHADSWIAVRIRPAGKLWPNLAINSSVAVRLK
ncbi:MAG: HlyD family secretion protein [Planctomycetaceae bacterium]